MARSIILGLASVGLATAHFGLNYPQAFSANEDNQNTAPCGGATIALDSNSPEIPVDQFPLSIYTSHPTGSFSLFATNSTSEPYEWTELTPAVVNTTGAGDFCLTHLSIPSEWAGQEAILQVIDTGVHGSLYSCAPVRFVEGANTTVGDSCTNSTGFTAEVSNDPTDTTEPSSTGAAEQPAQTSQGAAALNGVVGSVLGLGLLAAGLAI